jgi:hypothetical protein
MRSLYAGQGRAAAAERVLTEGRRIDPRDMCDGPGCLDRFRGGIS